MTAASRLTIKTSSTRFLMAPEIVLGKCKSTSFLCSTNLKSMVHQGSSLGNAETRLVLAKMIWNFDIELCDETDTDWMDQQVYLSWQKKPLIMMLAARKAD